MTNVFSNKADGSYGEDAVIDVRVQFSQQVQVSGSPQLLLNTGSGGQYATYSYTSGTNTLVFTYVVQAGDTSSHLDYTSAAALTLNGGSITNVVGANATLTLPVPGASGSLSANTALAVETVPPSVTAVTSTSADGSYKAGTTLSLHVAFTVPVTVTGTPQLRLASGPTSHNALYASTSGNILNFTYTVQNGDATGRLDFLSTNALILNGGTIVDAAGNNAVLILPSPGAAGSLGANAALALLTANPAAPVITAPTASSSLATTTPSVTGTKPAATAWTLYDGATTVASGTLSAGSSWSAAVSALSQGAHSFTAKASDAAGNLSPLSAAVAVTIDTIAPAAPVITAPSSPTNNSSLSLSGTAEALSTVQIYNGASLLGTAATGSGGNWTYTPISPWADGTYALTAKAVDAAGNTSPASSSVSLVINTVAPTITNVTSTLIDGSYNSRPSYSRSAGVLGPVTVSGTPAYTWRLAASSPTPSTQAAAGLRPSSFRLPSSAATAPRRST